MFSSKSDTEQFASAAALCAVGGFLDIYTYLYRGHVFANAVTGNMVLFGLSAARLEWSSCAKYLLAIAFYAAGIFMAEIIQNRLPKSRRYGWHQTTLLLEILCLLPVIFLPYGRMDFAVNALISFVCALQVQTFRRVRGLPFASTMCTGNLKSASEAIQQRIFQGDRNGLKVAALYYSMILFFIAGAAVGAIVLKRFGHEMFFLAPAGLLFVVCATLTKWQIALLRKPFRLFLPRRGGGRG